MFVSSGGNGQDGECSYRVGNDKYNYIQEMKMTRKSRILFLATASLLLMAAVNPSIAGEEKKIETVTESVSMPVNVVFNEQDTYKFVEVEDVKRPYTPSIPLPSSVLDFAWECSNKYGISYTLGLSVLKTESDFDINLVSKTNDVGIAQINKRTAKWIASELKMNTYDLRDPKTNIEFMFFYLNYLRNYWKQHGLSNEQTFELTVISYNRGIEGAKNYIKRHGYQNIYLQKVKENKYKIEQEMSE